MNARIKVRGVTCQVESRRAGKSNAEAKLWIEVKRVFGGSSVAGVSASVGSSSVATGSPSQADFFKMGQVDDFVLVCVSIVSMLLDVLTLYVGKQD